MVVNGSLKHHYLTALSILSVMRATILLASCRCIPSVVAFQFPMQHQRNTNYYFYAKAQHRYNNVNSYCSSIFTLQSISSSTPSNEVSSLQREIILNQELEKIGVDATSLNDANIQSMQDPTTGYNYEFGKSAIKTYRAFINPKKEQELFDPIKLSAAATRCAHQIDFLMKRHKSHQTEWIRHHDAPADARAQERKMFPLILVLDNIRSAFNVGSLFRTADACGCQQVITTGITPHPFGNGADKVAKSALGAELLVPTRHFTTTQSAISYLREELSDFEIIAMETTEQSEKYTNILYPSKVALIMGNEVTGVDTKILTKLDKIIEIPTFGTKNSLNVAACAPIALYEILRQWKV